MDIFLATVSSWAVGGIVLLTTEGTATYMAYPLALLTFAIVLALFKIGKKQ